MRHGFGCSCSLYLNSGINRSDFRRLEARPSTLRARGYTTFDGKQEAGREAHTILGGR